MNTTRLNHNEVTYLKRHPLALRDFSGTHFDLMSRRFQTKDEVQIGTAEVSFVHVSKQSKCFFLQNLLNETSSVKGHDN
jgi:hypothetical protein